MDLKMRINSYSALAVSVLSYLDELRIKLQALLLVDQELLNILALVALKLDHLAHLRVADNGAIASYSREVRDGDSKGQA